MADPDPIRNDLLKPLFSQLDGTPETEPDSADTEYGQIVTQRQGNKYPIKNNSGTINKFRVVRFVPGDGGTPSDGLQYAKASNSASAEVWGVSLNTATDTAKVAVVLSGEVNIELETGKTATTGNKLYLSQTEDGKVTTTKPTSGIIKAIGIAQESEDAGGFVWAKLEPEKTTVAGEDDVLTAMFDETMVQGNVIRVAGNSRVAKAIADTLTDSRAIGVCAEDGLEDEEHAIDIKGIVRTKLVAGLTLEPGDPIWLSMDTAGEGTNVEPTTSTKFKKLLGYIFDKLSYNGTDNFLVDMTWQPQEAVKKA